MKRRLIHISSTIFICGLLLMGCTKDGRIIYIPDPEEEQPPTTPLVMVVYGPNGLGDRSYCDLIYNGVEAAARRLGLRTLQLSPETEELGMVYLETMFHQMETASDSVRRLFITPSPVYEEFIRENNKRLDRNPNADLLFMETTTPLEGKGSTFYIDYYGAMYMGGCMVHYSAKDLVSVLLANPYTQSVLEAAEGFQDGFNDTPQFNEKQPVLLHTRYLSDEIGGGFSLEDSTALRILNEELELVGSTSDITFVPICGGSMHPLMRAIRSKIWMSYLYIGIDGDMNVDRRYCSFSIIKRVDEITADCISKWLNGTLPKHQNFGLADGATAVLMDNVPFYMKAANLNMDSLKQVAIRKEGERYEE